MPDLSTLDETQPLDSEIIALGAERIRETREAIITSFDLEHALTGEHTYQRGTTGARPAPGAETSIYYNTERQPEQVISAAWQLLRAIKSNRAYTAAPGTILAGAGFQQIEDVNISASAGGFVLTLFRCVMNVTPAGVSESVLGSARFKLNGANLVEPTGGRPFAWTFTTTGAGNNFFSLFPYMDFGIFNLGSGLAEGTHNIAYEISSGFSDIDITHSELIALII